MTTPPPTDTDDATFTGGHDALPTICARCGKEATGLASIGVLRFCHGDDDPTPTCYERKQWDLSGVRPDLTMLQNELRVQEEA